MGDDEIAQQHSGSGSNNQRPWHVSQWPKEPPNEKGKTDIGMWSLGQYRSRPYRIGSLLGSLRRMVTITLRKEGDFSFLL